MTPLERENRRLRDENDELRETVRQYAEQERNEAPLPDGLPSMTPQEETLLRVLLRSPEVHSRERLYRAIYGGETDVLGRIIDVHLTHIRQKLKPLGYRLVTHWGRGWKLECPSAKLVNASLTVPMNTGVSNEFEANKAA